MSHEACGHCGNNHPAIGAYDHIENCSDRINRGEPLMLAQADDLVTIARCLHSQLYAAHVDQNNYALRIQELQAENTHLRHGVAPPEGALLHSETEYGVRRRNGVVFQTTALGEAISRFDAWEEQARDIGFDSSGAEIVSRKRATYVREWNPIPDADIAKEREEIAFEAEL
jgi:hypothetical protein